MQPEVVLHIVTKNNQIIDLAGNKLSNFNGMMPVVCRHAIIANHSSIKTNDSQIQIASAPILSLKNRDFTISMWFQAATKNFNLDSWTIALGALNYWDTTPNMWFAIMPTFSNGYVGSHGDTCIINSDKVDLSTPYQPCVLMRAPTLSEYTQYILLPTKKVAPTNDMKPHHFALTRQNNTYYFFYDGKLINQYIAPDNNLSFSLNDDQPLLCCGGSYSSGNNNGFNGYMDDIYILRNQALWTHDFTPPTNYFFSSKNIFLDSKNSAWGTSHIQ